jgi:hypothetical protein
VLESRHVIGLFLLMLVFSGVFFALGYVMGRNQYDGQVRAANNGMGLVEPVLSAKPDVVPKKTATPPNDSGDRARDFHHPIPRNFYDKGQVPKSSVASGESFKDVAHSMPSKPLSASLLRRHLPSRRTYRLRKTGECAAPSGAIVLQVGPRETG